MSASVRATITPIVLVVLAAGAVAYVWFVDRGSVSDAERASRRSDVFPSFHIEDVTHVELVHGGETLVLDRDRDAGGGGSAWTMTSPRHEHADAGAVDALLRELALATRVRGVSDGDAVGLDEPRVRGLVRVGALEWRFVLGADAPRPEGAAYMRLEGEGTFVVQRSVKVQLLRGADAYRPRAILPYGASDVRSIHVATAPSPPGDGGGPTAFTLERQRAGGATFRVVEDGMRASRETMDRILAALTEARAESFVDDAQADAQLALAQAEFAFTVEPQDAARPRVELKLGGSCPGQASDDLLVETAPVRVSACVERTLADALRDAKSVLDDAAPFFAHADEMEEVRLEPVGVAGPRVELSRKGARWHERAPEDRDLSSDETDSANALALALASARGSQVRRAPEPFAARARVTIVRTGGSSTEVVELGAAEADGSVWARRADDGAFVRLAAPQARRFEPHPAALRPTVLWHSPFDPGAVVGIDDTCGPVPEKLVLQGGTWTMLAPTGFAVDPVAVTDLAGAVAHAKADAWIAEADDGSLGLGRPRGCAVILTLAAPDGGPGRSVTLSFGADAGGGAFYARASDDPAVFVAPGVLRALATHPAIDRSRFHLDPQALGSVTVVREPGDHRRAVALDGDADALARAVEGLYAEAALHTGAPGKSEGMDHPTLELVGAGVHISIGAPVPNMREGGIDGYYARAAGVDATFIVPTHVVGAIVAAMGN